MFKRLLSYFVPINQFKRHSSISKTLEVTWVNGELVLDSRNTNYSFGSLQRILRRGLKEISYEKVRQMQSILVLGVAAGSVIRTIRDEIRSEAHITGVDLDPEVIAIARKHFGLDEIPNLEIVIDDAFEFVLRTKKTYDLIIIDVFADTDMPNFLFQQFFANRCSEILSAGGYILFNTMTLTGRHNQRNEEYIAYFDPDNYDARSIPRLEEHNELILVHKKS